MSNSGLWFCRIDKLIPVMNTSPILLHFAGTVSVLMELKRISIIMD